MGNLRLADMFKTIQWCEELLLIGFTADVAGLLFTAYKLLSGHHEHLNWIYRSHDPVRHEVSFQSLH